jgi:DNA sulfur modification protein DndC
MNIFQDSLSEGITLKFPEEKETFKILDSIINKHKKWMITYSGGKDSTLLLHLVLKYLVENNNIDKIEHIKIVYVNTLLEFPSIRNWAHKFLSSIEKFVNDNPKFKNKFSIIEVIPEKDFIYNMILKKPPHYPLPHWKFPWCKKDLKIVPSEKNKEDYLVLVGVRKDESRERIKYYNKKKKIFDYKAMPILHWTTKKVFYYLIKNDKPFWSDDISYKVDLIENVYKLDLKNRIPSDEKSLLRYGCWLCPLATYNDIKPILNGYYDLPKIKKLMHLVNIDDKNRVFKNGRKRGLNLRGRISFAVIFAYVFKKYPELFDDYIKFKKSTITNMFDLILSQNKDFLEDIISDIKTKSKDLDLDFDISINDIKELYLNLSQ